MNESAGEGERPSSDRRSGDVRLLNASLIAAILIEVVPTEAGLLTLPFMVAPSFPISTPTRILLYLCIKIPLLILILTPLGCYLWANGLHGIGRVKWRVASIAAIVVLNLAVNLIGICRMIR
jgi:hypothetical protein